MLDALKKYIQNLLCAFIQWNMWVVALVLFFLNFYLIAGLHRRIIALFQRYSFLNFYNGVLFYAFLGVIATIGVVFVLYCARLFITSLHARLVQVEKDRDAEKGNHTQTVDELERKHRYHVSGLEREHHTVVQKLQCSVDTFRQRNETLGARARGLEENVASRDMTITTLERDLELLREKHTILNQKYLDLCRKVVEDSSQGVIADVQKVKKPRVKLRFDVLKDGDE